MYEDLTDMNKLKAVLNDVLIIFYFIFKFSLYVLRTNVYKTVVDKDFTL